MPIESLGSKPITMTKNPRSNHRATFSNGAKAMDARGWMVWNSRYRRGTVPQSTIYSEETVCVVRTRSAFAAELQTDDSLVFDGYEYSVQEVHTVEPPRGINGKQYEVSLK